MLIDARFNVDTTVFRMLGLQGLLTDFLATPEAVRAYLDHDPEEAGKQRDLLAVRGLDDESPATSHPAVVVSEVASGSRGDDGEETGTEKRRRLPNLFSRREPDPAP